MVVTVGAINKFGDEDEAAAEESDDAKRREKSKNVMYRSSEKTGGERPIDLVRNTSPILIVDEPQSVEIGRAASRERRSRYGYISVVGVASKKKTTRYNTHKAQHNEKKN